MELNELISKYKEAVIKHITYSMIDAKIANKNYFISNECYKELKKMKEGINELKKILHSDNPSIREAVATHLLPFDEEEAKAVLKELEDGDYKINSLNAKYILKEWENGNLKKRLLSM